MPWLNRPVEFPGTREEAARNFNTHYFSGEDGRCLDCDCKPWHVAAHCPCGESPPRETVWIEPPSKKNLSGSPKEVTK